MPLPDGENVSTRRAILEALRQKVSPPKVSLAYRLGVLISGWTMVKRQHAHRVERNEQRFLFTYVETLCRRPTPMRRPLAACGTHKVNGCRSPISTPPPRRSYSLTKYFAC